MRGEGRPPTARSASPAMTLLEKPTTLSGISLSPIARKVRWAIAGRRAETRGGVQE